MHFMLPQYNFEIPLYTSQFFTSFHLFFSFPFSFRLMELLFDMQQYGQPPAEIIKDLAPGLKFDENGMPIMPNMGAGMMPGKYVRTIRLY